MSWYNVLNVFTFACYAFLLRISSNREVDYYTSQRLFSLVFVYSLIFVGLYMIVSLYYRNNTFLFSEADARKYERFSIELLNLPISDWFAFLSKHGWGFDDWGTPIFMASVYSIVPHKLFLNFVYVLLNALCSLMLFKIGQRIMDVCYAFMASLSYSLSSYVFFFIGSGLKEIVFVFLVIFCFYMLYQYERTRELFFIFVGVGISMLVLFFRVPVACFIWMSFFCFFYYKNRNKVVKTLFVVLLGIVSFIAMGAFVYSIDHYIGDGGITETYRFVNYSSFQKYVSYIATLIGPFPDLLQTKEELTIKSFYGSGVLFKLLLFFSFWKGITLCIRNKIYLLFPILLFVFLEMLGILIVLDGLELRKNLAHMPFSYLIAFWYMCEFDKDVNDNISQTSYYVWSRREYYFCVIIVFSITLLWNSIR